MVKLSSLSDLTYCPLTALIIYEVKYIIIIICPSLLSLLAQTCFISWPVTHLRSWTNETALGFTSEPACQLPASKAMLGAWRRILHPCTSAPQGRVHPSASTADPGLQKPPARGEEGRRPRAAKGNGTRAEKRSRDPGRLRQSHVLNCFRYLG